MKKRFLLVAFFMVIGVALFVSVIMQTGIGQIWNALRAFSLPKFLLFLLVSLINFGLYTLRWDLILRGLDKNNPKVGFFRLYLHRMSGFALSYLTPSAQTGGEPLRIMLLHSDGVNTKNATASVIIDKALEYAALFVFIGIGIALALFDGSLLGNAEWIFGGVLVIFIATIFWFYYSSVKNIGFFSSILRFLRLTKFKKIKQLEEKIVEIEQHMSAFYKSNIKLFFALIAISLVITSFLLLEHYMVASFMGVQLTFMQTFLASTVPYIAYVIPVPGGLGLLEGGHAAMFAALGVTINAFVLVFIIRIRDLIFVLLGLIHASKQSINILRSNYNKK